MSEVVDSERIDFKLLDDEMVHIDTIHEEWHEYEVEDKTIIKTKWVLMKIIAYGEPNPDGTRLNRIGGQTLTVIHSPKEIRGPPDKTWTVTELEPYITEPNALFRQIQNGGINKYETEKASIEAEYRVTQIDKTSKYDVEGMPSYIVRTSTNYVVMQKEVQSNPESNTQ